MSIQDVWFAYNIAKLLTKKKEKVKAIEQNGPFRPLQWGSKNTPESLIDNKTNIGGFFFDAIIRVEHTSSLKLTEHPVQTGANIVDHSYMQPAVLVMEIGMSDSMDGMTSTDQFTGYYTRSVGAFQLLKDLQEARLPLFVCTRLAYYKNMIIEEIVTPDDYKTLYGLRCTVTLRELFIAEVSTTTVSAREHVTDSTNGGMVQTVEPSETIISAMGG